MSEVEDLAAAVEEADDVEGALWELWGSIVAIAARTEPENQLDLVALVVALRERGDVDTVWELSLWTDLPVLGAQLREAWSWAAPPSTDDDTWLNVNAFTARLTASGYDSGMLALWTLDAAVGPEATDADRDAARAWLVLAGDVLRAWSEERRSFDGVSDPGYSPQRLDAWRAALLS